MATTVSIESFNVDSNTSVSCGIKRKREKLDHLTEEEKLMRRKLKNRISAQTARDRKKEKLGELEYKLSKLSKTNGTLLQENIDLKKRLDLVDSNERRILQLESENRMLKDKLESLEKMINNGNHNHSHHQRTTIKVDDSMDSGTERSLDTSFEPAEEPRGKQGESSDIDHDINCFINCDGEDIIKWLHSCSNQIHQNIDMLSDDSGIEDGSQSDATFTQLFSKSKHEEPKEEEKMASIRDLITFDHMYHRNRSQLVELSTSPSITIPNEYGNIINSSNIFTTEMNSIQIDTKSDSSFLTTTSTTNTTNSNQSLIQLDDDFLSNDLPMETIFFDDLFPELG